MARIRTIKPEFQQSESMGRVSRDARLLFILLWPFADDSGKARGNSRMLASGLFPYDEDAPRLIDGWLDELEREQCIIRYEVDGASYLQIVNWSKHQRIDKPQPSKLPPFDDNSEIIREHSRTFHVGPGPGSYKRNSVPNGTGAPRRSADESSQKRPDLDDQPPAKSRPPPDDPKAEYFRRGRDVLGKPSGSLLAKLLRHFGNEDDQRTIAHARAAIEQASTKAVPVEWVGRVLAGKSVDGGDDKFTRAML